MSAGRELATRHFEAGQKLDIALLACSAALADAELLLGCAKLRPAFGQLVLGICFVFRAALDPGANGETCRFRVAVSGDIEGGQSVGGPGHIGRTCDNGAYSKNEATHFGFSVEYVSRTPRSPRAYTPLADGVTKPTAAHRRRPPCRR